MKAAAVAAALLLAGCGAPRAYLGIDLRQPAASRDAHAVQRAAAAAANGDKAAMLALGGMLEDRGDLDRACLAYRDAGRTTGGTVYLYSPPVTKGGAGRVMPVTTPVSPGLPAAQERHAGLVYRATAAEKAGSACLRGE